MRTEEIRRSIVGVAAIAWFYGIAPLRRNIYWSFHYALAPLAFLFFIYLYGGSGSVGYALAGGFVMVTVTASVSMETEAAFNRIVLKLHEMYVASPVRPLTYVIGLALANQLSAAPGVATFLVITTALTLLTPLLFFTIIFSLITVWITFSVLGYIISTLVRDLRDLWTWSPIITGLVSVLPPVFYPLELLPEALRGVAYIIPTATAARLVHIAIGAVTAAQQEWILLWTAAAIQSTIAIAVLLRNTRWRIT
ncbi:MAG: ABC transporter permease [Aigarchaeota archaeon]|nr:ABC transporter permease [Candidatus Pelearchaeum maunauluense]